MSQKKAAGPAPARNMRELFTPLSSYRPVNTTDSGSSRFSGSEGLDEEDNFLPKDRPAATTRRSRWGVSTVRLLVEVTLLLLSVVALGITVSYRQPLDKQQKACGRLLGHWLPDAEQGVEYEVQKFRGTFGLDTPFTGIGPEVDAAWDNITLLERGMGITKEQMEAVNDYPDYAVMLNRDHGTGQYLATLDVFHQLHCLDLLRKSLHREHYNDLDGSLKGMPEDVVQKHLKHCIEQLRQTLMCHGDITLMTYNWVEGRDIPHPNFNTIHTCKKWDTIYQWNIDRDVTSDWVPGLGKVITKPPVKPKGMKGMKEAP